MSIKAVCNDLQIKDEGEIVLPVEFIEILKQAPEESIEIKINQEELRAEVKSGQAVFILYGMNRRISPEQL